MSDQPDQRQEVTDTEIGGPDDEDDEDELVDWSSPQLHDIDLDKYDIVKRPPIHPKLGLHNIFVSTGSQFVVIMKKVDKILKRDRKAVVALHAIGKAIPKAIDISLEIAKRNYGQVSTIPMTSTVPLVDDFIPKVPGLPHYSQVRYNSAIHIRLFYKDSWPKTNPPAKRTATPAPVATTSPAPPPITPPTTSTAPSAAFAAAKQDKMQVDPAGDEEDLGTVV